MKASGKAKTNKLVQIISSTKIRAIESRKPSRSGKTKEQRKFTDTICIARPMFNPIAGP